MLLLIAANGYLTPAKVFLTLHYELRCYSNFIPPFFLKRKVGFINLPQDLEKQHLCWPILTVLPPFYFLHAIVLSIKCIGHVQI